MSSDRGITPAHLGISMTWQLEPYKKLVRDVLHVLNTQDPDTDAGAREIAQAWWRLQDSRESVYKCPDFVERAIRRYLRSVPISTGREDVLVWSTPQKVKHRQALAEQACRMRPIQRGANWASRRKSLKPPTLPKSAESMNGRVRGVAFAAGTTGVRGSSSKVFVRDTAAFATDGYRLHLAFGFWGPSGARPVSGHGRLGPPDTYEDDPRYVNDYLPPAAGGTLDVGAIPEVARIDDWELTYRRCRQGFLFPAGDNAGAVYVNPDGSLGFASCNDEGECVSGVGDGAKFLGAINGTFLREAMEMLLFMGEGRALVRSQNMSRTTVFVCGERGTMAVIQPVTEYTEPKWLLPM